MKIKPENDEVFYIDDSPVGIQKCDFEKLYDFALKSNRNRARYCAHQNKEASLHEMFEIFTRQTYLRPLKQIKKSYSYHIIHGSVDLYLFTEQGDVSNIIELGDYESEKIFYFSPPKNVYRTLITRSKFVLYHEVTTGPFAKEDSIFAPWAPIESDSDGIKHFLSELEKEKVTYDN